MLKKFFISLFVLILLAIIGISGILFTQPGNNIIASYIEKKVNQEQDTVKLSVQKLSISLDSLVLNAQIDDGSKIDVNGGFHLLSQDINFNYKINIKELAYLEPLIGQRLNGPLNTQGNVKGSLAQMQVKGYTDVAHSKTQYNITLIDNKPTVANIQMQHAQINKLLYLVNQPLYLNGNLNINGKVNLSNFDNLQGKAIITVLNGKPNTVLINKEFKQNLPSWIKFNLQSQVLLAGQNAIITTDVKSNVANISAKKTQLNIKKNSLTTDYQVYVPNLAVLGNMLKQKIRGSLKVTGDAQFANQSLKVKGYSNIFGGKASFTLHNDQLNAQLRSLSLIKVLHTFYYPEIFRSLANADISYNIVQEKGIINANLINGKFINNRFTHIVKELSHVDLTREVYQNIRLDSEINHQELISNLDMQSKATHITVQKGKLNLKNNTLNMPVNVKVKDVGLKLGLTGNIQKPHISFDANEVAKQKAHKEIQRGINKLIKGDSKEDKALKGALELLNKKLF